MHSSLNESCCKIQREDYFPDESGRLVFHAKLDWSLEGYSVAELLELLQKYGDRVSDILFQASDMNEHKLLNIFEVDNIGTAGDYSCIINVGVPGEVLKVYGNPDNSNWLTDSLRHY